MLLKTKLCLMSLLLWILSLFLTNNVLAWWFWDMVGVAGIHTIWTEKKQNDSLLFTIQTAINWVLWILATITLFIILYAWFMMMTSWGDSKKYDSWFNIIKNAALWLVIIALSWLIVSFIFYVIFGSTGFIKNS